MNGLSIIPECYLDTCLVETITGHFDQFNHQKGCNTVVRKMQEKFNDSFAVGIIDRDKREVPYLQEFELIASQESLFLHKHRTKHHYIIQISPAIESFFLKATNEMGIDIATEYELPSDIQNLTKITKQVSGKNENTFKTFKRLFTRISEATEFGRLAKLIKYLGDNTYNIDIEELKRICCQP